MAERSAIEWTDSTFNPWIGCTRVSPACDHCYAAVSTPARAMGITWGHDQARRRTSAANWKNPLRWERNHRAFHEKHGRRRRVFCASLADVFDNAVPDAWRADLFRLIEKTPHLDWLLLTKRIGNVEKMVAEAADQIDYGEGWQSMWAQHVWPENVWLGATICNQTEADRDIPKLLAVPAHFRFLSIEPMLGPITFRWAPYAHQAEATDYRDYLNRHGEVNEFEALRKIDWIIAGGESGAAARPANPDWMRMLRDQCAMVGVPFFFKQWGEWAPIHYWDEHGRAIVHMASSKTETVVGDPMRPATLINMERCGKRQAGRLLDGLVHDGCPSPTDRG